MSFSRRLWLLITESFIAGIVASLIRKPKSFILRIPHESCIDIAWRESYGYKVLDWIVNLLPRMFGALYRRFPRAFDSSLLFGLLSKLSDNLGLLSGLFLAAVLIIPQKYWNNMYSLLGALALACLFLVYAMRKRGRGFSIGEIGPYIAAFAVFAVISFLTSDSRSLSLRFLAFHLTCMIMTLIIVSTITDRKQLNFFLIAMLAGFAIAVAYGCYQAKVGVKVVLWQVDTTVNKNMPGRVYSFFENPNGFAELLTMLTPFVAVMIANEKETLGKILALLVLGGCIVAMAATYSRAGYMAFAAIFALFVLFLNWKLIPVFLVLGIVMIPVLPDSVYYRLLSIVKGDSSISSRAYTYNSAIKLIADNWGLGIGLGTDVVQKTANCYSYYSNGYKFIHSHNTFMQIWVEMGILGLVSFLGSVSNWFKRSSAWIIDGRCPADLRNVILAGVAGIIGALIFGLVDYVWFYPRVMLIFWAVVSVTISAVRLAAGEANRSAGTETQA